MNKSQVGIVGSGVSLCCCWQMEMFRTSLKNNVAVENKY